MEITHKMARRVINPTLTKSLQTTAVEELQKLINSGIKNNALLKAQSEKNRIEKEKLDFDRSKQSKKDAEEAIKFQKADTKLYNDEFYDPIEKASISGTLSDIYQAEASLGFIDGNYKIDAMREKMVPFEQESNYKKGAELASDLDKRKKNLISAQSWERQLVSSNVSGEDKAIIMDDVFQAAEDGWLPDSELNSFITRAQKQRVPGYEIPKEQSGGMTLTGASSNFTSASKQWDLYEKFYTPDKVNVDRFMSSQEDYGEFLTLKQKDATRGEALAEEKRRFNAASIEKANNIFLDLTVGEQSAKTFEAFEGNAQAQSRMVATYGGLALESIAELKEVNSENYSAFINKIENKEIKAELIKKLSIALGPSENWEKYLDTSKYPSAKFKVINE